MAALLGAAFVSVVPLHVFQSRFLYGHEVVGVFFITLAIWALVNFFSKPSIKGGLISSLFIGLYLISHGYILSFFLCLLYIIFFYMPSGVKTDIFNNVQKNKKNLIYTAILCIALSVLFNPKFIVRFFTKTQDL